MTPPLYLVIQEIVMGSIFALGCNLLFINIPPTLKGSHIHASCRVIGVAIIIIPLSSFIYYFTDLRTFNHQYVTAVNLTAYSTMSTLLSLAYFILLDQISDRTFIKIHLTIGLLYTLPLWIVLPFGSEYVIKHVIIISHTLFCILSAINISTCIYFYRQKCIKCRDTKKELQKIELKLIGRTIYISLALILIGIFTSLFPSCPLWLCLIFVTCYVCGSLYNYICFYRILTSNINSLIQPDIEIIDDIESTEDIEIIEDIEKPIECTVVTISDDIKLRIEKPLQDWVKTKEYVQPNISINYVARVIGTNRTYLSRYINSVLGLSFKTWITQLRIIEAKEIMSKTPNLPISEVAKQTGFSSIETFSHIFTRHQQTSPSSWRKNNTLS